MSSTERVREPYPRVLSPFGGLAVGGRQGEPYPPLLGYFPIEMWKQENRPLLQSLPAAAGVRKPCPWAEVARVAGRKGSLAII